MKENIRVQLFLEFIKDVKTVEVLSTRFNLKERNFGGKKF